MKIIRTPNAIRLQYTSSSYNDSLFSKTTAINVVGTDIEIVNDFDPTPVNIKFSYADVTAPITNDINELRDIMQGWVNEANKVVAKIIEIPNSPVQSPTNNRLQSRNDELYWNGNVLLATGSVGPVIGFNGREQYVYVGANGTFELPFFNRTVVVNGLGIDSSAIIQFPPVTVFTSKATTPRFKIIITELPSIAIRIQATGGGTTISNNFAGLSTSFVDISVAKGEVYEVFLDPDPTLQRWIVYKVR